MRANARAFASQIELPCTVACGDDEGFKLRGTAVRIDPARMVLRIQGRNRTRPRVGEEVQLDVHLPVNAQGFVPKDLRLRARILEVTEVRDGVRSFVLSFRRAQFKNRSEPAPPAKRKAATGTWEM